ncbi:white protein, putative [Perkinsus marinus ATCC 50983]|uniref:White protein, putative n=1 Tax=Perkinsus marinus (strain ATCC 50983 / TXsc) TaxID=423536 RepID=C5M163_PERM5|nr:white protein, putative [Perkinsus marinus ATCC 50983]EEQ97293.1 white protein, putative [Perkinsus marinus ATCC 50983]|eukprot:XP_002764576.1 white protein, putative [Perkinsus marinus ATCC 50983]
MAGCFAPNPKTAMEAGPLLFVPQILFAGFFVDLSEVPAFLRWVQYLCSLKYAMNLLFLAEFSDQPGGRNRQLVVNTTILYRPSRPSGYRYKLVEVLKKLNADGRCIVATIHQPSSEVFHLFDEVLFLWEGYCIYHGPVDEVEAYFAGLGHPVPESFNPADFVLFLIQTLDAEELRLRKRNMFSDTTA